jgi:excinuclease UvrABC nuclease subunit
MESQKETAGNLQEAYLAAPGISEENVQAILSAFPTFAALATAPVSEVQAASGLSKSACRRLQTWASSK